MVLQLKWGLLAGPISRSVKNIYINETTQREYGQDLLAQPIAYRTRTRIGTWNVRTLAEPSRLAQACREMENYRLDILGLSEVRWKGQGEFRTATGQHFIYCGNNNSHMHGVGILLSSKTKKSLIGFKAISERLISARFRTKYRNITVLQCYAPTEVDEDDVKNAFYEQLDAEIAMTKKKRYKNYPW